MSAGRFEQSRYQSNRGNIYRIRVQPETLALTVGGEANDPPAGAVDQESSARVSGGNNAIGVKARSVTLRWTGAVPTGYLANELLRVPILQESVWDNIDLDATGTYLGSAVVVVGKSANAFGKSPPPTRPLTKPLTP